MQLVALADLGQSRCQGRGVCEEEEGGRRRTFQGAGGQEVGGSAEIQHLCQIQAPFPEQYTAAPGCSGLLGSTPPPEVAQMKGYPLDKLLMCYSGEGGRGKGKDSPCPHSRCP